MPRKAISVSDYSAPATASKKVLRRSRRIQAMRQNPPNAASECDASGARKVKNDLFADTELVYKRKRKVKNLESDLDQITVAPAKKPRTSPRTKAAVSPATRPSGCDKRRVHFVDGELEPLAVTPSPLERAKAVTVEYLISQAFKSKIPEGDIREVACPEDARSRIAPIRVEGRKGDYLRFPLVFALAYPYAVTKIFHHLYSRGQAVDSGIGPTLAALRKRVLTELGMEEGRGFAETMNDGRTVYVFIVSWSDRPETLLYPEARIRKIQEILGVKELPSVLPLRRSNVRL
ncbi:hypothetical protein BD626DRAFT_626953 [Schizophyllum amplum]|uniref:Uncharacterized protein n=1 Tax=Schizophyllum amplum TaxID=97359 RepID=A0A550CV71_9AGAR|nr:hypothetical protein BD626DRAFT_626953 [Auriculariopsis ampla]